MDGDFKIQKFELEVDKIEPNLSAQARLLEVIQKPQRFEFLTPFLTQLIVNSTDFSVPFDFPRPTDYVFIMFKDRANISHNGDALLSKTQTTHGNIKDLILSLNSKKYPGEAQNADFANGKYKQFYNEYCLSAEKLFLDIPINTDDYRDLYPIFGFDLTDQKTIFRSSTAIKVTVTGTRTVLEPKEMDIFICGFVVSKYTVDYNKMMVEDYMGQRVK